MGFIFAITGVVVLLAILFVVAVFWLIAMVSLMSFMIGGFLSMALFGGQDAFYFGGIISLLVSWAGMAIFGNKIDKDS